MALNVGTSTEAVAENTIFEKKLSQHSESEAALQLTILIKIGTDAQRQSGEVQRLVRCCGAHQRKISDFSAVHRQKDRGESERLR